ncbi:MAG: hypothetical protein GYA48_00320 [Chloroflexi bacterium]|nr:hypothetical protein [Chloroflexota bacterium]
MKTHVIQLERHDDYLSAKDKISWSKAQRVLLVWPERGRPKIFALDLKLLDRYAAASGARLALVTQNIAITEEAYHQGIPVFETIEQARKNSWRVPREWRKSRVAVAEKRPDFNQLAAQHADRKAVARLPKWVETTAFILGLFAVFGLFLFFAPGAAIRIDSAEESQTLDMQMWASPEITAANLAGGIPARPRTITVEGEDSLETSGVSMLPTQFARGKVLFSNLTEDELLIPRGTVVLSGGDPALRYQTLQAVALGGKNSVEVEVEALQGGSAGNVEAGEIRGIEGVVGLSASVENLEAIQGGSETEGKSAAAADFDLLRARLIEKLRQQALQQIQAQAGSGELIIPESLSVGDPIEETFSVEEGEPADRLALALNMEFTLWVISEADMKTAANSAMDATLPAGYQVLQDSLSVHMIDAPEMQNQRAVWTVRAERSLQPRIEPADVYRVAVGKPAQEAVLRLADLPGVEAVDVQTKPGWWPVVSYLPQRISIEVK